MIDIMEFIYETPDKFFDFYITKDRNRIFINKLDILKSLLKTQECYGLFDEGWKGLLILYYEKGFRKYVKFLAKNLDNAEKLIRYLLWNHSEELYAKLKKDNPIVSLLLNKGFISLGDRGREILLIKPYIKFRNQRGNYDKYNN